MRKFRTLIIPLVLLFLIVFAFEGCGVARQASQASNLINCEFRVLSVENVNLAGVELQRINSISDLGMTDVALLLAGFSSPVCPLSLRLNLEGRNPNMKEAGLNRLDWILFVDDIQMTSGIMDTPFTIPPLSTSTIPVEVGLDVKQVLSGTSAEAMLNFCMNLTGTGTTPTRFKIKLKPTIIIAGVAMKYPGYITVKTDYTSK